MDFFFDFKQQFDVFPTFEAIHKELSEVQDDSLLNYVKELEQNPEILVIPEDSEFIVHSKKVERIVFEQDVFACVSKFQQEIKTNPVKDLDSIGNPVDELISGLHQSKNKILKNEASTSGLLYGAEALDQLQGIYDNILQKKKDEEFLYYTLGFEKFEDVRMTKGDLVIIGGFTSHGKSVVARNITYRLLTEYGLNCYYCSLEMAYDKMKLLFLILHANNKNIFSPDSPRISYTKLKEGDLSPEERDFIFGEVATDFYTNKNYGTLFLEYPNKSRFRLSDLQNRITELENTVMPIHAVIPDYLTMFYPLESDKGTPDRQDYNQMIKEFKNTALSHRSRTGQPSPFIAVSPAQISRGGLDNAIKNSNCYDLSALREYSELESSADIVLTTMLTPEGREKQELLLQNLKNRDGKVIPDPIALQCDLEYGFGMYAKDTPKDTEMLNRIQSLFRKPI